MSYAAQLARNMKPGDSVEREAWIRSAQSFRVSVLRGLYSRGLFLSMDETRTAFPVVLLSKEDKPDDSR